MTRPSSNPFYIAGRPMTRVLRGGFPISDRPYLEEAIANAQPRPRDTPAPAVNRMLWWQPSRRRAARARNLPITRRPQLRALAEVRRSMRWS
jgi:hypothetical protein